MGIRKVSIGLAAAALLGTTPVMAAAPVTPSVAKLSLAPAAGANIAGSRLGAVRSKHSSDIGGSAAVIGVLAAAAVVGGVVAATSDGHSSVSP